MRWDEIDDCEPDDFTIFTMPARFAEIGDLHGGIDNEVFDITPLLEWAERDEAAGPSRPKTPTGGVTTRRGTDPMRVTSPRTGWLLTDDRLR